MIKRPISAEANVDLRIYDPRKVRGLFENLQRKLREAGAERDACLVRLAENDEEIMRLRAECEALRKEADRLQIAMNETCQRMNIEMMTPDQFWKLLDAAAQRRWMARSANHRMEDFDATTQRWNELGEMTRAIYRRHAVCGGAIRLSLDEADHEEE